jgi:hypothetical protein
VTVNLVISDTDETPISLDEYGIPTKFQSIDESERFRPLIKRRSYAEAKEELMKPWRFNSFTENYNPIKYTVDGVIPAASIYGVTAKRGTGKTTFLTSVAFAVATGRSDILGLDVEKGRVAYFIMENPEDFRMKLRVTAAMYGIDGGSIADSLLVYDRRGPVSEAVAWAERIAAVNGPFQLVCYDTFQAGFSGADFNDNNDALKHATDLRAFTTLPGKPSVLVACHPVKNATRDNLEPYGGGATMNELDGNLTLWGDDGLVELHHNKVRGPNFKPLRFQIEYQGSPETLDHKGRQPQLPVLYRAAEGVRKPEKQTSPHQSAILAAIRENPGASVRRIGEIVGLSKSTVERHLQKMPNLVSQQSGGTWVLIEAAFEVCPAVSQLSHNT